MNLILFAYYLLTGDCKSCHAMPYFRQIIVSRWLQTVHFLNLASKDNTSGERFWLEEQGDQIWFCHNFDTAGGWTGRRPTEMHLETRRLGGLNTTEPLSDAKILFDQSATAIAFPRSLLSLPLGSLSDRQDFQRYQDYELLYSSALATNFPGSVRQIIATLLREQHPDIQLVAELVGMSVRSFQRQLQDLNLTYSHLVEQVRFEQSLRLLHDPAVKLADIASELSNTDAANFTRGFKQWTGISPTEFRHLRWKM